MAGSNCYNSITLWLQPSITLTLWKTSINQVSVFSPTCDSPTDAISDCLNVYRVRKRFVATSFFLVPAVACSWWFFGFFCVTTANIFSSVNKIVLTSLDEYFFSNYIEWLEWYMTVHFTQLWSIFNSIQFNV